MIVQSNNNNVNYLNDPTLLKLTECLCYLFKELLQKITKQNIIETFFYANVYQTLK